MGPAPSCHGDHRVHQVVTHTVCVARGGSAVWGHGSPLPSPLFLQIGQWASALECYSSSLEYGPNCLAFANRAMARLKLEQWSEAEEVRRWSRAGVPGGLRVLGAWARLSGPRQRRCAVGAGLGCLGVLMSG